MRNIFLILLAFSGIYFQDNDCFCQEPNSEVIAHLRTSHIPLDENELPYNSCFISKTRSILVATSRNVYRKDLDSRKWNKYFSLPNVFDHVLFSSDGKVALLINWDGSYSAWNPETRKIISSLNLSGAYQQISLSPNGKLISFAKNDILNIWNTTTEIPQLVSPLLSYSVEHAEFIGNSTLLLTSREALYCFHMAKDRSLHKVLWERPLAKTQSTRIRNSARSPQIRHQIAYSRNGDSIAYIRDNSVSVLEAKDGSTIGTYHVDDAMISAVALSHDSRFLVVSYYYSTNTDSIATLGTSDNNLKTIDLPSEGGYRIFSLKSGKPVFDSKRISIPQSVTYSASNSFLSVVLQDGSVVLVTTK